MSREKIPSDDTWTKSLRSFIASIGYTSFGWGLGRNHGRVPELLPKLIQCTTEYEVLSSHLGLVASLVVFRKVARLLA